MNTYLLKSDIQFVHQFGFLHGLFWIFDRFGVLSFNMPLCVPWAEVGTGLKMAMLFYASSSEVCVRPRQSSGKVNASVKRFKSAHRRKIHLDRRNLRTGK